MVTRMAHQTQVSPAADVGTLFVAGVLGYVAWEIWATVIAPSAFLGRALTIDHIIGPAFGIGDFISTLFVQVALAVAVYPLLYYFLYRPLTRSMEVNWVISVVVYGAILWFLTTFVFAHLMLGYSAFFGFNDYSLGILGGQIVYSATLSIVMRARDPNAD